MLWSALSSLAFPITKCLLPPTPLLRSNTNHYHLLFWLQQKLLNRSFYIHSCSCPIHWEGKDGFKIELNTVSLKNLQWLPDNLRISLNNLQSHSKWPQPKITFLPPTLPLNPTILDFCSLNAPNSCIFYTTSILLR